MGLLHESPASIVRFAQPYLSTSRGALQDAAAYFGRGTAYAVNGNLEQARRDLDMAIQFRPNYVAALVNRGQTLAKLGEHSRAIADYDRAIAIDPGLTVAYADRGLAYLRTGQHKRAIASYDRAIEIGPQDADAYGGRGLAYLELAQRERAIADFQKANELRPGDKTATLGLWLLAQDGISPTSSPTGHDRPCQTFSAGVRSAPLGSLPSVEFPVR